MGKSEVVNWILASGGISYTELEGEKERRGEGGKG